jgi:hypothetical protein
MNFLRFLKNRDKTQVFNPDEPRRLNLGCGLMYLENWINVDISPDVRSDLQCDFLSIKEHYDANSIEEIMLLHSISYLRLWEARIFFSDMYRLLKNEGKLILEFPDIIKCGRILGDTKSEEEYLECVRAIYAFDLDQIKRKEAFTTYAFGWSAWHISQELKKVGFSKIEILEPKSHGERGWRDSRVVASK